MALGTVPTNALECFKGEDFTPTWVVGSDLTSDITGWTIVLTIKDSDNSPTFTSTTSGTVTDGPNRLFKVVLPAATTAAITVGAHLYDVWRTNSGFAWVLSIGSFTIKTERRVATP